MAPVIVLLSCPLRRLPSGPTQNNSGGVSSAAGLVNTQEIVKGLPAVGVLDEDVDILRDDVWTVITQQ